MTPIIPDWVRLRERSMIRFQVSEGMVDKFSVMTGDRSALHVSEAFARRSAYRQPVVHGMLPVAFLSLVGGLRIDGQICRIGSINGQFAAPVYIGETLDLIVEPAKHQDSASEIAFDYHIEKTIAKERVTEGRFTVLYENHRSPLPMQSSNEGSAAGLLVNPISARDLGLEEISKGKSDGFEFLITEESIRSFLAILAEGVQDKEIVSEAMLSGGFHFPNLLTVALFSTLVGMRLPGHSATFLEFSAKFEEEIKSGKPYRLEGQVAHISRSTNIIKTNISISQGDDGQIKVSAAGKVATLVNQPFRAMPTMKDLRASAVDMGLKDKVVLITGASRGIGETTAKLFALFGARVIVNYYRGKEDADRIVQEILDEGGAAIAVRADVTQFDQVQEMVGKGIDRYGAIHILVNNAVRSFRPVSFADLTWDEIQKDLDVIVKGAFHCCKAVAPFMLEQGGGKIINISSIAVDDPPPDQLKYVLSKSALVGLARSLSMEFSSRNIQVNTVVPNFVETDLVSHIQESFRKKIANDTPMNRHASPVDVAQAVLFLASAFSSYTTGQRIMVTGGKLPYL
jgi:3-oxoacyl-[acyl-carrier protein] reductase